MMDVTHLTGVVCREKGYDAPMFGYIHAAMKYYVKANSKELENSTGEDVARYFRLVAPIAYRYLKKANALTIKDASKFRDGLKNGRVKLF